MTSLVLDTAPPLLTITNPAINVASQPVIQLQGFANESLSSLSYDVSNATGIWTNQDGYITGQYCDTNLLAITTNYFQCYDLALTTNGGNLITLHAVDLAGNSFTTNINVTLDLSASTNSPVCSLIWPQDGSMVAGTNCTLHGLVSDPTASISVTVAGTNGVTNVYSGIVTGDGNIWVNGISLAGGVNTVTATATSATGNSTATTINITPNDVGLTLDPLSNTQQNQPSVNLTGSIGDPSYSVTVNGVTATVSGYPVWEADNVPVNPSGTASVYIEVRDSFENLVAAQTFYLKQPAYVALMSYSRRASEYKSEFGTGLIWQSWFPDYSWLGLPPNWENFGSIPAGPSYFSYNDTIFWTYLAGGSEESLPFIQERSEVVAGKIRKTSFCQSPP